MASTFPTTIDSFNDPTASNTLSSPSHSVLHQDENDAIEKVETKLGTGSSTPTSGALLIGNGVGSSIWDTSPVVTLDTPTLNTPDLNGTELILDANADTSITADTNDQIDIKINGADDFRFTANTFTALTGSVISTPTITDTNGNEELKFTTTASAVNEFTVTNAATGNAPALSTTGGDTNIDLKLTPKGTGRVKKGSNNIDIYEELGSTTLTGTTDTISVTSITAKTFLRVIVSTASVTDTTRITFRFNSDSGNNYAFRTSANGAADSTATSQSVLVASATANSDHFLVADILNVATKEKRLTGLENEGVAGAATAPGRFEVYGKWANTTDQITRIDVINDGAGDFAIGSTVRVYGHD